MEWMKAQVNLRCTETNIFDSKITVLQLLSISLISLNLRCSTNIILGISILLRYEPFFSEFKSERRFVESLHFFFVISQMHPIKNIKVSFHFATNYSFWCDFHF